MQGDDLQHVCTYELEIRVTIALAKKTFEA